MALVERAARAGYDTLLATVDVPVAGARLRDARNGMSIPPALTASTVLDALRRPRWWIDDSGHPNAVCSAVAVGSTEPDVKAGESTSGA